MYIHPSVRRSRINLARAGRTGTSSSAETDEQLSTFVGCCHLLIGTALAEATSLSADKWLVGIEEFVRSARLTRADTFVEISEAAFGASSAAAEADFLEFVNVGGKSLGTIAGHGARVKEASTGAIRSNSRSMTAETWALEGNRQVQNFKDAGDRLRWMGMITRG